MAQNDLKFACLQQPTLIVQRSRKKMGYLSSTTLQPMITRDQPLQLNQNLERGEFIMANLEIPPRSLEAKPNSKIWGLLMLAIVLHHLCFPLCSKSTLCVTFERAAELSDILDCPKRPVTIFQDVSKQTKPSMSWKSMKEPQKYVINSQQGSCLTF